MGVAAFIVAERDVPGVEPQGVCGKAVARSNLDRRDPGGGRRPLADFLSISPDEAAAFADEVGAPVPPGGFPPEEWFAAADGLATVRALLAFLAEHPTDHRSTPDVVRDLRDFERVLAGLDAAGVRWHLQYDI